MAAKTLSEYKDQFTLDGRLKVQPYVEKRKVQAVQHLIEGAKAGSYSAKGQLEEALTSSDAIFNWAHLMNINILPQYDALEPTWQQVAGTRIVPDFRPATLWSLVSRWSETLEQQGADPAVNNAPHGIAPVVPEGSNYPYAYMSGVESQSGGIKKRGFKTDFTFEAFINDSVGFIAALPGNILDVAHDTADYDVYNVLTTGVATSYQLAGGATPDGTEVLPNSPLTRAAIIRAVYELSRRRINNRYIKVTGGYNLLVPLGQKVFVDFFINQTITDVKDGSLSLSAGVYNTLGNVTVIESEWINDGDWFILPKPGATRRPVIDYGYLVGHQDPEIRVENSTGTILGGGGVTPFEGSFDNDSATFRLRQIGGPILWTPELVVWSNGTGVA